MAITKCLSCGERVSNQWPECPSCGTVPGEKNRKRRRFNPTVHYMLSSTIATIGALIYGGQFFGQQVNPTMMLIALGMIVLGACWYAGTRILAGMR